MGNRKNRVLMLLENYFPSDIRVRREAETLAANGYAVTVIALRKMGQPSRESFKHIEVYRIPELVLFKKPVGKADTFLYRIIMRVRPIIGYASEYTYFTAACLFKSLTLWFRNGFDILHSHNPPDTLFAVGAFYRLFGKKFVFDHHDLSPELFSVRFNQKGGAIKRILIILEGLCCRLANAVICSNASYKTIDMERHHIKDDKIFVVRNNPNLIPSDAYSSKSDKKIPFTILYLGSINPQDGVDLLMAAIEKLVYQFKITNFKCIIVGDGDSLPTIKEIAKEKNIEDYTQFCGYVFDRQSIFHLLAGADICVEPAPDNELNRHSTFIKVMEYMSAGKPIVAFDLKENRFAAEGAAILVRDTDIDGFAQAIKCLMENDSLRKELGDAGRNRIRSELNWEVASQNLLKAYESIG